MSIATLWNHLVQRPVRLGRANAVDEVARAVERVVASDLAGLPPLAIDGVVVRVIEGTPTPELAALVEGDGFRDALRRRLARGPAARRLPAEIVVRHAQADGTRGVRIEVETELPPPATARLQAPGFVGDLPTGARVVLVGRGPRRARMARAPNDIVLPGAWAHVSRDAFTLRYAAGPDAWDLWVDEGGAGRTWVAPGGGIPREPIPGMPFRLWDGCEIRLTDGADPPVHQTTLGFLTPAPGGDEDE